MPDSYESYEDEASRIPASELFGREDARRAMAWVDELLELFEELLHSGSV